MQTDSSSPIICTTSWTVVVYDMFHEHDPEDDEVIRGFATEEIAIEFARRRIRSSVEHLRRQYPERKLRDEWFSFGINCVVQGSKFRAADELADFIRYVATPDQCDWQSLYPRDKGTQASGATASDTGEAL